MVKILRQCTFYLLLGFSLSKCMIMNKNNIYFKDEREVRIFLSSVYKNYIKIPELGEENNQSYFYIVDDKRVFEFNSKIKRGKWHENYNSLKEEFITRGIVNIKEDISSYWDLFLIKKPFFRYKEFLLNLEENKEYFLNKVNELANQIVVPSKMDTLTINLLNSKLNRFVNLEQEDKIVELEIPLIVLAGEYLISKYGGLWRLEKEENQIYEEYLSPYVEYKGKKYDISYMVYRSLYKGRYYNDELSIDIRTVFTTIDVFASGKIKTSVPSSD